MSGGGGEIHRILEAIVDDTGRIASPQKRHWREEFPRRHQTMPIELAGRYIDERLIPSGVDPDSIKMEHGRLRTDETGWLVTYVHDRRIPPD